jgi:hypothetical protein
MRVVVLIFDILGICNAYIQQISTAAMDFFWDDDQYTEVVMILMQAGMLNKENNIVPSEQAAPHVWGSGSCRGKAPNLERLNSCVFWLGDGIYPSYACFVKTFPHPTTRMQKMFASAQEDKRKDIGRAFGILQARFHILTSGCFLWNRLAMKQVKKTCVVLHNLIIDYEMKNNVDSTYIAEA